MRFLTTIALVAITTVAVPTEAVTHWGPELESSWTPPSTWNTTNIQPTNWHNNDGKCNLWFVDDTSAACCVDRSTGAKFGHCTTSSQHNCPGKNVEATCTTGQNEDDSKQHQGSCPWSGTNDDPQTIYAVCRPADDQCLSNGHHCWGTIACYTNNNPVVNGGSKVDCDQGIYNTKGSKIWTYKEGDFCFETGNSDNTKWCGTECTTGWNPIENICCPNGYNSQTQTCNEDDEGPGPTPRPNPTCAPGSCGDPQFVGFHGQSYQFHGLADEIFNLVSTPTLQVNGHFVYLSAGKCDYNDTLCWTHPGTYVDQIGMMFQDRRVTFIAGTHDAGLHWKINDEPITKYGIYKFAQSNGADVILTYHHHNSVRVTSELFNFRIVNSDMFFNIEAGLNDKHLLKIGAPRHTITDRILCEKEAHVDETKFQHASHSNETTGEHNHGAVEAMLQKKYGGIQVPIHGLIGQTWRNALVCGRHWIGAVSDYVCSDLFASDYFFNYFHE